jgi:hypothetical protein
MKYPWQTSDSNLPPTTAHPVIEGDLKRKREGPGNDRAGSLESPYKRQQSTSPGANGTHDSYRRTYGSGLPPGGILQRAEVIEILDDDEPPAQIPAWQGQRQAFSPAPLVGTQERPFEIDTSPPPRPTIMPLPIPTGIASLQQYRAPTVSPAKASKTPTDDIVPIVEPVLCKEQEDLVNLILSGQNVFYTGSAGCGKSTVLKAFVKRFREQGLEVKIIAPTGRAALDINGSTTWTYAGWTPDHHKKPLKELKAGAHGKFVRKRLQETNVLIFDEISMVENHHFERLNVLMKEARGDSRAFGGVQVIVTGDFCQLPPVKPFG